MTSGASEQKLESRCKVGSGHASDERRCLSYDQRMKTANATELQLIRVLNKKQPFVIKQKNGGVVSYHSLT